MKNAPACELCTKYCGCSRRDCGLEGDEMPNRIIIDQIVEDPKWCKQERRMVQMEEEEMDDHGDDD